MDKEKGNKIFISYKYKDDQVFNLKVDENSTVRDYVERLEELLESTNHIYKGESDGEDLSCLSEETIWEKLKTRIYDSTITIVAISPGMREFEKNDNEQWIPREISYSLKEEARINTKGEAVKSKTNALIGLVLPDENNSYSYFMEGNRCCEKTCISYRIDHLFEILKGNMFNRIKNYSRYTCEGNVTVWNEPCSYMKIIQWPVFLSSYQEVIKDAIDRQEHIEEYKVKKEIYVDHI